MAELAYLSLGSNMGDRGQHLRAAISRLASLGRVLSVSAFYEAEPVEVTDQPWFLNCVVTLETLRTPPQLMQDILQIERDMGRKRTREKGPRTIDIDILLFGECLIEDEGLTIPHPAMHERRFVLAPLAEIAPDAIHPRLHRSAREMLEALPVGQQTVRKYTGQ